MKRCLLLLLLASGLNAQQQHIAFRYYIKELYGSFGDFTVRQTPDSGYILLRHQMANFGNNYFDKGSSLVRLDKYGNFLWSKKYNEGSNTINHDVAVCGSNGFAYATSVALPGDRDISLTRVDNQGNLIWTRRYGRAGIFESFSALLRLPDGGFLIGGGGQDGGQGRFLVIRTDSSGQMLWSHFYNIIPSGDQILANMARLTDGSFVFIGNTSGGGPPALGILRTDSLGNILWSKQFTNTLSLGVMGLGTYDSPAICATDDGGIFALSIVSIPNSLSHTTMIRLDSAGNVLWSKFIGFAGNLFSSYDNVVQMRDGGFAFPASYVIDLNNPNGYDFALTIVRVDSTGEPMWCRYVQDTSYYQPFCLGFDRTSDDGVVLLSTQQFYWGYLMKTDSLGFTSCNDSTISITTIPAQYTFVNTGNRFGGVPQNTYSVVPQNDNITKSEICLSVITVPPPPPPPPPPDPVDTLFIPNVFTPNEDGINDFFEIVYSGSEKFKLTIYDRWGIMMYTQEDLTKPWNGKNRNGERASDGTYYYVAEFGLKKYSGFLTLLR